MHHGLQQRCEQVLADHVEALFERARARGMENQGAANLKYLVLETPYLGLLYSVVDDDLIAQLKPLVVRALAWRERFRTTKPDWSPDLPISLDAIDKLQSSASKRMRQVGDYAYALLLSRWDESHPEFFEWLTMKRRRPDDEQLEWWAGFIKRIDAGIIHRGAVANL